LVIDLRPLNAYVAPVKCRFEGLRSLRRTARRNDWMFSFDLADGYHCVGIDPRDQHYMTFILNGQAFSAAALPFGYHRSPQIFSKVMRTLVKYLRAPNRAHETSFVTHRIRLRRARGASHRTKVIGVRCLPYLDDFMFMVQGRREAYRIREWVGLTLERLGLQRQPAKGHWRPTQVLDHLGLRVDTRRGLYLVPPDRVNRIQSTAKDLLCRAARDRRLVPARRLASFAGLVQSVYLAVPPARYFTRSLYDVISTKASWSSNVRMSRQATIDVQWWVNFPQRWNGRAIWEIPTEGELHTDSSGRGWGAELALRGRVVPAYGLWGPNDLGLHITYKELKAVRRSLTAFLRYLPRHRILLWCDNMAVVHILKNQVSRVPLMMGELRKLMWLLTTHQISLDPRYVPTDANVADPWSRIPRGEWMVHPDLFRELDGLMGPHTIDRYATRCTAQLPRYCGLGHDTWAVLPSAYMGDWREEVNWLVPPFGDIGRAVYHLRVTGARGTIVVPDWPQQDWYTDLMEIAMPGRIVEFRVAPDTIRDLGGCAAPYLMMPVMLAVHVPLRPRTRC
jgi:hypothetical protein